MVFSYTFKLTSSKTQINLPVSIPTSKNLKIRFLRYTTASTGNEFMIIKITGFNRNYYYDGTNFLNCVKTIPLPSATNSLWIYENQLEQPDIFMDEKQYYEGINQLIIELLINNTYSADINSGNPLYMELLIY